MAADQVSRLYEEHPYPAHGVIGTVLARLVGPVLAEGPPRRPRLLDAGCGTGEQTLGVARAHSDAEVVGVDLNAASIAFARDLARRHGIAARFETADLLGPLDGLGSFDVIVSVGVLHHLDQPARALARLRAVAAPGARLVAMLYGVYGRAPLFDARDAFARAAGTDDREARLAVAADVRLGVNRGPAHLAREAVRRLRFGPDLGPVEAVRRAVGGRSPAYQADAFTHPVERAFSLTEAADLLAASGWRLDGWPARSGLPDRASQLFRSPTAERVERLPVLERGAIYERLVRPSNLYLTATAVEGGGA
ncbi:MAG TPA: class I SAM-dependent methyltransferase [Iamia sp.]